jgi:glycosyltransferase involved in cell wall biosynthesis
VTRPIRIGIDLTARLPLVTGVDTYLERLVVALGEVDHHNRYTVWVNLEDRAFFHGRLPGNFGVAARCLRPRPIRLLFQQLGIPALALVGGFDVVHSPSFITPMIRGRERHLLTVYDMTFFSRPECHEPLRRSAPYRWAIANSLVRADMVSVPSCATRDAVVRFVPAVDPGKLKVVPPGIDDVFTPRPADEIRAVKDRLGITGPYVLYLGTLEPRKNLTRLVRAFARLAKTEGSDEQLVLAGVLGWDHGPLLDAISGCGVGDRVRRTGYVPADDLPALLSGAELFVYPSLEEGFGFPPLEAMACGTPTVVSDSSSLAENLRGAAELAPPTDVGALAAAMARMLTDDELRMKRRRQGLERAARFRWRRTAEETADCYRALVRETDPRSQDFPV